MPNGLADLIRKMLIAVKTQVVTIENASRGKTASRAV